MKKKEAVGKTHCLVTLKKLRMGVVIEWVVATPGWLSSFRVRGGQTNGRGSYSNGWSVGVRGEAKRKGGGRMGWLSSVGCEVGPKEWPGIIFEWVVAAVGWLSSFGVRGEQTNGRGSYSNERNVGVRGEAK